MKPILPRARFGVFIKAKKTGKLEFSDNMDQDDKFPKDETGYVTPADGDSGSAYTKLVTVRKGLRKETRVVVVALHSLSYRADENELQGILMKNWYRQCRSIGSKITPEVTEWIKKKASII